MTEFPIESLIPHRGAMRLIDRLVHLDGDSAVAEADVASDGLFVTDGRVPAWAGIEYMAQTVAAWSGARSRQQGGTPRLGLLLGSRRYVNHGGDFPCGATLRIETRCELIGDNGLGLFDCRVLMGGVEMATATVSVYEPEDAMAFFAAEAPK